MRFAAIADIHGNCFALQAVLADAADLGVQEFVNLGDHVSGPLEAAKTADLLMELGFPSVRGDQDRRLLELQKVGSSKRSDFQQLSETHFDWLASLSATLVYHDDVFLCHATPTDDAKFWLDQATADGTVRPSGREEIEAEAVGLKASLILCGHTHIQRVVRLPDGRLIVNPGSVGLPGFRGRGPVPYKVEIGTPHASYAIIERKRDAWSVTLRFVPYDSRAAAEMAQHAGMSDWASALASGWVD